MEASVTSIEIKQHINGKWCVVENGYWYPFGASCKPGKDDGTAASIKKDILPIIGIKSSVGWHTFFDSSYFCYKNRKSSVEIDSTHRQSNFPRISEDFIQVQRNKKDDNWCVVLGDKWYPFGKEVGALVHCQAMLKQIEKGGQAELDKFANTFAYLSGSQVEPHPKLSSLIDTAVLIEGIWDDNGAKVGQLPTDGTPTVMATVQQHQNSHWCVVYKGWWYPWGTYSDKEAQTRATKLNIGDKETLTKFETQYYAHPDYQSIECFYAHMRKEHDNPSKPVKTVEPVKPKRWVGEHSTGAWCVIENGYWYPFGTKHSCEDHLNDDDLMGFVAYQGYKKTVPVDPGPAFPADASKTSTVPGSDNLKEGNKDIAAKGYPEYEGVAAKPNQIMLDYDVPYHAFIRDISVYVPKYGDLLNILKNDRFSHWVDKPCNGVVAEPFKSKSGNTHIVISLPENITDLERIAWQAAFGSDPVKEALSIVAVDKDVKNPVILFRPKDEVVNGRLFRDEE